MSNDIKNNLNKFVICKSDNPKDFDLVIMNAKHRLAHVGLFVTINESPFVLHTFFRSESILRTEIKDLFLIGLNLEGFYKWQEF